MPTPMYTHFIEGKRERTRETERDSAGGAQTVTHNPQKKKDEDLITDAQADIDAIYYEQIETRGHNLILFLNFFLYKHHADMDALSPQPSEHQGHKPDKSILFFLFFPCNFNLIGLFHKLQRIRQKNLTDGSDPK